MRHPEVWAAALLAGLAAAGCITTPGDLAEDMAAAALDSDDPQIVRDGMPTFILMLEGRLRGDPEDVELLRAAAGMYSAYAAAFVDDAERRTRLSARAFDYASRAFALAQPCIGSLRAVTQDEFLSSLERLEADDVPLAFELAQAWMTWIRERPDDLDAMADLPRVQALLERVLELDESYQDGAPHMFLGVLRALREVMMGGDPEPARRHFERALELSGRRNLMVQVAYARAFAAALADEALYHALLGEVVDADPHEPGRTLMNVVAQQQARDLLAEGGMRFQP